jgi:hypothetical protein
LKAAWAEAGIAETVAAINPSTAIARMRVKFVFMVVFLSGTCFSLVSGAFSLEYTPNREHFTCRGTSYSCGIWFFRRKIFRFKAMATINRVAEADPERLRRGKELSNRIVSYLIGYAFSGFGLFLQ